MSSFEEGPSSLEFFIDINRSTIAMRFLQPISRALHRRYASSSVNPQTIDHFSNKFGTKDWWFGSGDVKVLRALNHIRVPLIRDSLLAGRPITVGHPLADFKIADAGCGAGLACEPLARLGARVFGIDPTVELISQANRHLEDNSPDLKGNLTYVNSSVEEFVSDSNKGTFDAVLSSEVAEHIEGLDPYFAAISSLLKSGGHLVITTISQTLLSQAVYVWFAEYVINMIPKGTHSYKLFVPPHSLRLMLEDRK